LVPDAPNLSVGAVPEGITFRWRSEPGTVYRVEISDQLGTPWQVLRRVSGTGGDVSVTDGPSVLEARFYRVVVE
jgi:hypothetical protein